MKPTRQKYELWACQRLMNKSKELDMNSRRLFYTVTLNAFFDLSNRERMVFNVARGHLQRARFLRIRFYSSFNTSHHQNNKKSWKTISTLSLSPCCLSTELPSILDGTPGMTRFCFLRSISWSSENISSLFKTSLLAPFCKRRCSLAHAINMLGKRRQCLL